MESYTTSGISIVCEILEDISARVSNDLSLDQIMVIILEVTVDHLCAYIDSIDQYLASHLSFWSILGVLGN